MGWGSHLAEGVKPVVDLIYPPRCPSCGAALRDQDGLCAPCWETLDLAPLADDGLVHAATLYTETSRKLVLTFKHGGRIALARLLGRLMAARLPVPDPGRPPPLLVPVPLHRWRLWQRGYNQAALLAGELERLGKGELAVDALRRVKRTPSLGGLGRDAREAMLKGAIVVSSRWRSRIAGRDIIVVDDVLTSGATTGACMAALREAGAAEIAIACFARVDQPGASGPRCAASQNITPGAVKTPGAT